MAYHPYYQSSSETKKAEWNMDDEILKIIKELKSLFIIYMNEWDLKNAYFILRQLRMEIDAKLKPDEQKEAESKMGELENKRREYLKNQKEKKGEFYRSCEKYYIFLNRLMKDHGLFFREKMEDEGL